MSDSAHDLYTLLTELLGEEPPFRVRTWDGSEAGPADAPLMALTDRRALRHLLWAPNELGLARAYVSGAITLPDEDGDPTHADDGDGDDDNPDDPDDPDRADLTGLYELLRRIGRLTEQRPELSLRPFDLKSALTPGNPRALFGPDTRRMVATAARLGALGPRPPIPPEEMRHTRGPVHTLRRDRAAISHHYDVGNDFYRLVLGSSMVYSCAYWPPGTTTLEAAQKAKLDLVCRKLGLHRLGPDARLLDVGCGWGSMLLHAAQHYGVRGVGVTLSAEQARLARERIAEAGLTDRLEVRLQDYREIDDGPFDAISSIGMAEHVGSAMYRRYARTLYGLLRPGGRLLNHQIARRPDARGEAYRLSPFIAAYVFPDGELAPIGSTVAALEGAGFEVRDVESLREHYALTLRRWVTNLQEEWTQAVKLAGLGRARVWRLYMAASALAFEENRIGVNQVLAVRTGPEGLSGLPLSRGAWLDLDPVRPEENGEV
ncbi:SAM-dependent methyltransferase [Streptacidiphilus jiangxiensis]|uniref:Cyclopropane-fatty-acyl-phospholipid synthase n=1 Tax=Streptacidiphilus jiangxiensis TaxID=235985 RepID=A0A1H7FDK2_STRJI|nr:cyclopropane-fatty-acyl-phospholipid synthase family protein [Streptacidiphilus jiangxiensis]SEK22150.1 cyclopropane-fatty-acyl-phospholipid synthase [Streptacidiphilus jiangxiensis]